MYTLIKQDGSTRGEGLGERYNTTSIALHGDGFTTMSISNLRYGYIKKILWLNFKIFKNFWNF